MLVLIDWLPPTRPADAAQPPSHSTVIASYTYGICLENPRHTGYLTDDVGDGEAGRDHDNRRHTKFE